jgi:MarC family membrane protein
MLLEYAISALLTLFVVVDPIAMAPTFLVVTEGMPRASRQSVAVLDTLEISLSAFRIAGGLLLFWIAAEMVFGVRSRHEGEAAEQALEERVRNVAAFPLAIPLLAGPGAITATLLLATRAGGNMILIGTLIAVVLLIAFSCWITFVCAERISGLLGKTGNIVLSRLLGVLLAALAVQYVVDGIRSVLAG